MGRKRGGSRNNVHFHLATRGIQVDRRWTQTNPEGDSEARLSRLDPCLSVITEFPRNSLDFGCGLAVCAGQYDNRSRADLVVERFERGVRTVPGEVLRRWKARIRNARPITRLPFPNMEGQRFFVGVNHHVKVSLVEFPATQAHRKGV